MGHTPTVTNGLGAAAIWADNLKPLMYLGLLGALGGLMFWASAPGHQ